VLLAIVASQRVGDLLLRGVDATVAMLGELLGIGVPATMSRRMRIPVSPVRSVMTL